MPNQRDKSKALIALWVHKDDKERYKQEAAKLGMTVTEWVQAACEAKAERKNIYASKKSTRKA